MVSSWSHDYWPYYPVNAPRTHSWADCNWRPPPCPSLHFRSNIANIPGQVKSKIVRNATLSKLFVTPHLRSVIVSVALYLRCEYVPLPLVGAPVGRVQLDCDPGLASISLENKDWHEFIIWLHTTYSGGGRGARGPHVEVDVVPGVVAAQVSCLVPESRPLIGQDTK